MKDRTGQLFWGLFLITLGSLFILSKYQFAYIDWSVVWDLWPIVLVFWGVSVITKNTEFKPYISMAFGVFMGILIYGSFFYVFDDNYYDDDDQSYTVQTFTEDYDSAYTSATLNVKSGVGKFTISRTTSDLVRAVVKGEYADYNFYTESQDSTIDATIEYEKDHITFFEADIKNNLDIKLNEAPVWDMNFKIGAAKNRFDFANFKVRSIDLETGATDTRIKIGEKYSETFVKVKMGAAALEILIPKDSGCKLTGDMVLFTKNLDGFTKINSNYHKTENYKSARNKIEIEIDGGVSSLKIRRY